MLTFLGLLTIVLWNYYASSDDPAMRMSDIFYSLTWTLLLRQHPMPLAWQLGVFGALFAGFAVKRRCFHCTRGCRWPMSKRHGRGSVLLAGVLLKVGVYGLRDSRCRCCPGPALPPMPWLLALAATGVLYGGWLHWPRTTSSGSSPIRASAIWPLHVGAFRPRPIEHPGERVGRWLCMGFRPAGCSPWWA